MLLLQLAVVNVLLLLAITCNAQQVCNSVEIRTPHDFEQLRSCHIVVGHVSIVNVQLPEIDANYSSSIVEITDYLLVHRVQGLHSLEQLFPHLVVLRGVELLFQKYALVVYENRDLRALALVSLLRIQQGAIRIESNPDLCFVDTVNWVQLLSNSTLQHFTLKNNKSPNHCPVCDSSALETEQSDERRDDYITTYCWHQNAYQRPSNVGQRNKCPSGCGTRGCDAIGRCCSSSCLTGCTRIGCDVCVNYRNGNKCVDNCNIPFQKLNKRECVLDCRKYKLIPHAGSCVARCPAHFELISNERNQTFCSPLCSGNFSIHTAQDLQGLQDCSIIKGSLDIELTDLKTHVISELELAFANLNEITGYLRIKHSPQLLSLSFLRKLTTIGGNDLIDNRYALYVVDNHHLEQIWADNQHVALLKGRVFFHMNPRLCHDKIMNLQSSLKSADKISIVDASPNSNGERVICGITVHTLNAIVEDTNSTAVRIKVNHMSSNNKDALIGYQHHYKEAPQRNVTMYDGRHGCGHDNWRMDITPNINVRHIINNLKPYTQYAYFVKTLTRTDYHVLIDAYSTIQYFRTMPSKPSPVAKIYSQSVSASEIVLHWWPPKNPNGIISQYIISYTSVPQEPKNTTTKNYPQQRNLSLDSCECADIETDTSGPIPEEQNYYNKQQIIFDEALPDLIYVARITNSMLDIPVNGTRSKRNSGSEPPATNIINDCITNDTTDNNTVADVLQSFNQAVEEKACLLQDTGIQDYPILHPWFVCAESDVSVQRQLEQHCQPLENYDGIVVPGFQHSYTLRQLLPESSYRITVRACVEGLKNGCGCETTLLAQTLSKRLETMLKDIREFN